MSVVTVRKPQEEIEALLRETAAESLYVLGCGKCAKVSRTGGTEQVIAMREALAAKVFSLVSADDAPLAIEDGACDPEAVQQAADRLRPLDFDVVLVLACGAGLKCVQDALPDLTIIPALNTLGPGVTEKLACLACGDCNFSEGRCNMLSVVDEARTRLHESYGC